MQVFIHRAGTLCLLLLCFCASAVAQRTWIYYQPEHTFLLVPADSGTTSTPFVSMLVLDSLASDTLQTLALPTLEWDPQRVYSNEQLRFEDFNFDGYPDLGIRTNSHYAYWTEWACWLYQPHTQLFEPDTALSKIWNTTVLTAQELIHTSWRIGLNEFGHALYGWRNGTLTLMAEEVESIPPWETEDGWYVTRRWRENGALLEEEDKTTEHRAYHHELECPLIPLLKQ